MTREHAIRILDSHSIRFAIGQGDWLEVEEVLVSDSGVERNWIECPRTVQSLLLWLGY